MKPKSILLSVLLVLLLVTGCGRVIQEQPSSEQSEQSEQDVLGLLEVTVTGVGEGTEPTATAQWVQPQERELSSQAATVVPVNGTSALNDIQLIRRAVSLYDNDVANTRHVTLTFDLVNRTAINFGNLTLYAVNVPGNLGGTGIASMTSGATPITNPAIARRFKPSHGMRPTVNSLRVNEDIADLQFFTPTEVNNPTNGIKQQAIASGILSSSATVLEYGFVARNFTGGRAINARNTSNDCTVDACKGTLTLAYSFPRVNPRGANPFGFRLLFVVANETVQIGSQSLEEQAANTVTGLSNFTNFQELRTLAGSSLGISNDGLNPLCRVRTAISPDVFLGPNPLPNAPGSLDICFGAGGKRTTALVSGARPVNAVAVQSDGKIVVAGRSFSSVGGPSDFALVRYNPNGSLDTTFDGDGKVTTELGSFDDEAKALAVQNDGKIVVAAELRLDAIALVRYNSDGSLDTSFGVGGIVSRSIFGSVGLDANALTVQGDGKILVAGERFVVSRNGNLINDRDFTLFRFNPDGSFDSSFGTNGIVTTNFGDDFSSDVATALAVQSDGKIVVAGKSNAACSCFTFDIALVRYNSDGSLDTTFGTGGIVITASGSSFNATPSLAIQGDGKIVVAGSDRNIALLRFNPDGSTDTSFGTNGIVTTTNTHAADALTLQRDGKIVTVGESNGDFALARYNTNGTLDTSFDTDGKVTTDFVGSSLDVARSVAIQSDGKIVTVGESNGDFALARYNP